MKLFSSLFLTFILFLTTILFVPKINGFTAEEVKDAMAVNETYIKIHQQINQYLVDNQAVSQDADINRIIQQTVTPDYIQAKLDNTLDQSAAWITGTSQTEPNISFNDLKQTLIDQHPQGVELSQALQQLEDMPQHIETAPQVTSDPQAQEALNTLLNNQQTIQAFSQGDITFHLKTYLEPLKLGYTIHSIALIVLPLVCLILAAIIIFTSRTRLKTASFILLSSGLGLSILAILSQLLFINWLLQAIYTQLDQHLPLASSLGQSFSQPWFANFLIIHLVIAGLLLIIGVVCLFLSKQRHHQPASSQPLTSPTLSTDSPSSPTTPTTPTQPTTQTSETL